MSSQNPVINQNGSATIETGENCTWNTPIGSNGNLSISNSSRANELNISISGAPTTNITVTVNGASQTNLNGMWTLPPNAPTMEVNAYGDFHGQTVTITNLTNPQNNAEAAIQCQTA